MDDNPIIITVLEPTDGILDPDTPFLIMLRKGMTEIWSKTFLENITLPGCRILERYYGKLDVTNQIDDNTLDASQVETIDDDTSAIFFIKDTTNGTYELVYFIKAIYLGLQTVTTPDILISINGNPGYQIQWSAEEKLTFSPYYVYPKKGLYWDTFTGYFAGMPKDEFNSARFNPDEAIETSRDEVLQRVTFTVCRPKNDAESEWHGRIGFGEESVSLTVWNRPGGPDMIRRDARRERRMHTWR